MDRIPYYLPPGFRRQIHPYLEAGYLSPEIADRMLQSGIPWESIACYIEDMGWWRKQTPKQAAQPRQDWEIQSWGATLELHTARWRVVIDPGDLCPLPSISSDVIVVTHAHHDHVARLLEYSLQDPLTPIVMSSITAELLAIKYPQPEMHKVLRHQTIKLDFEEVCTIRGINIRLLPAGHLLGAAMCVLEADQDRFLITGDFALHDVGGLPGADIPTESFQAIFIESSTAEPGTLPVADDETNRVPILRQIQQACLMGRDRIVIHSQSFGQAQEIYAGLAMAKWAGAFPELEIGFSGLPALVAKEYERILSPQAHAWRVPPVILNDYWIPPKTVLITSQMDNESNYEENTPTNGNPPEQAIYHIKAPVVFTHAGWGERIAFLTGTPCHIVYFYHGNRPTRLAEELNYIGRKTCYLN